MPKAAFANLSNVTDTDFFAKAIAGEYYPLKKFGPVGTADDTATFAAAIASGEVVIVPPLPGEAFYNVSQIVLKDRSSLIGLPQRTKVKALPTGVPLVVADSVYIANFVLSGFFFHGNKANQPSGATDVAHIIDIEGDFSGTYSTSEIRLHHSMMNSTDPRNRISHLMIWQAAGTGMRIKGRGGCDYSDISIFECDGYGLDISSFDSNYDRIDIGASGRHGVRGDGSTANNRISNVKSWYSGARGPSVAEGDNFHLVGCKYNEITNCESQDSWGNGWYLGAGTETNLMSIRSENCADSPQPTGFQTGSAEIVLDGAKYNQILVSVAHKGIAAGTPNGATYWLSLRNSAEENNITAVVRHYSKDAIQLTTGRLHNGLKINGEEKWWAFRTDPISGTLLLAANGVDTSGGNIGIKAWADASILPGTMDLNFYNAGTIRLIQEDLPTSTFLTVGYFSKTDCQLPYVSGWAAAKSGSDLNSVRFDAVTGGPTKVGMVAYGAGHASVGSVAHLFHLDYQLRYHNGTSFVNMITVTNSGARINLGVPVQLASYTAAQANALAGPFNNGAMIYCTDGDTGSTPCLAVRIGSAWKRVSLGTAI